MSFDIRHPPMLISAPLTGGPRLWAWEATDNLADITNVAGYMTGASSLGMKVNDVLQVTPRSGDVTTVGGVSHQYSVTRLIVTAIDTAGAATLG